MPADERADVDLTSLEVIRRYSLAVRQASAPRGELVAALRADLAWLEKGRAPRPAAATAPGARPAPRSAREAESASEPAPSRRTPGRTARKAGAGRAAAATKSGAPGR